MNIAIPINQFKINNVFYFERIKNTVMNDSNFIRLIYSNSLFSLNGVYMLISFEIEKIEKYFNKYKCIFNKQNNISVISNLIKLEHYILQKFKITNKEPRYTMKEQLLMGFIKIFSEHKNIQNINQFILKISGIWETDIDYGLTFKFIEVIHP